MARLTSCACPSPRRPLTATAKPSSARRRAITAPRPRELPVTKATRPSATGMQRSSHSAERMSRPSTAGAIREDADQRSLRPGISPGVRKRLFGRQIIGHLADWAGAGRSGGTTHLI
jgi:hypothetical protein